MTPSISNTSWTRWFVTKKEVVKTTWAFKTAVTVVLVLLVYLTRPLWAHAVAESLVCGQTEHREPVDAILIDDFESDYLLFERVRHLQESGLSSRVIAPVNVLADGSISPVGQEFVNVLARQARVRNVNTVPVGAGEPISLNAALRIRAFATENGIKSVMVVTPAFRSQRSMMIYQALLRPVGISAYCAPVFGGRRQDNWTRTWHGIQDVTLQFVKLQYYRWYVLPFRYDELQGSGR